MEVNYANMLAVASMLAADPAERYCAKASNLFMITAGQTRFAPQARSAAPMQHNAARLEFSLVCALLSIATRRVRRDTAAPFRCELSVATERAA